ncbi:MAG: hypothetical protein GEU79_12750 [Acidimicrobiia bacterium]|nr:hypothetical protein [Acidimicrobiia bacterium]
MPPSKEKAMRYLIMLYGPREGLDALSRGDFGDWTNEDVTAMMEHMGAINDELADRGELVDAAGLTGPSQAKAIRLSDGTPTVTDGPYLETKEVMAGYWVVDTETPERALEIAKRASLSPNPDGVDPGGVEVWPLQEEGPAPE